MSGSVVIALDDSDFSARALPIARRVAQQWRSHLILAHATPPHQRQLDIKLLLLEQQLRDEGIDVEAVSSPRPLPRPSSTSRGSGTRS